VHALSLFPPPVSLFVCLLQVGADIQASTGAAQNQMTVYVSEADGITKIEDLQQHSNNDIYEKCIKILETYFGAEDEEEMAALAPTEAGGQFGFGMDTTQPQGGFDFSGGQ